MFENKICLIIGGLGSIGLELSMRLANQGAKVIATSTSEDKISQNYHQNISNVILKDASNFNDVEKLCIDIIEKFQTIDIAINCAGSIMIKSAHQTSQSDFEDCLKTNLFSAFSLVRAVSKMVVTKGLTKENDKQVAILLFSSVAAKIGIANHEAISSAKSAIEGLVRSASATYASKNIRINAIAPSLTNTKLANFITKNPNALEASKTMHPLNRIGEVSDIANVAEMLINPQNSWITGQVISVDGGLSTIKKI